MVKQELLVTSYELEFKSESLNSRARFEIHVLTSKGAGSNPRDASMNLRVQIDKFKNHLINENSSKQR